jgi:hypothetical protein
VANDTSVCHITRPSAQIVVIITNLLKIVYSSGIDEPWVNLISSYVCGDKRISNNNLSSFMGHHMRNLWNSSENEWRNWRNKKILAFFSGKTGYS